MYHDSLKTSQLRDKLMSEGLDSSSLLTDPIKQFERWYAATCETDQPEPIPQTGNGSVSQAAAGQGN